MHRKILHIDLDAFFCAVEEILNPCLRGKPFVVGGRPETRGVVSSSSYAARKYGIRSAMPMVTAIKQYPDIIIIPPHFQQYSKYSRKVFEYVKEFTPLIEQISIDEAFMDVSDLPESEAEIAFKLQSTILKNLSLSCSIGVATNKLVAKIANDVGKASSKSNFPPNAITIVPPGDEALFLSSLPVEMLWGVGPKTSIRLKEFGILTIGQLADQPELEMARIFGKHGLEMSKRAKGIDHRPVITTHEVKSVSQETTFSSDVRDEKALLETIRMLSEQVGKRLRRVQKSGKTIKMKIRWANYETISRQTTLESPTDLDQVITDAAIRLFKSTWVEGKPVRLLGVGITGFEEKIRQLNLWEKFENGESSTDDRLQSTLDSLRNRYGKRIIFQASELKK